MPVIIIEGTGPGWSVSKVKQIVCYKEWATNKADEVYNVPEECLHDGSQPPLTPSVFAMSSSTIFLLTA